MKNNMLMAAAFTLIVVSCANLNAQAQPIWRKLPNAPTSSSRFNDVFFVNAQIGWIIQSQDGVFKTTDGGKSWRSLYTRPGMSMRSIGFADEARGWLGALPSNTTLMQTEDGGATWREITNFPEPKPRGICGISVVNRDVMYGAGWYDGDPRVVKTSDGGQTWQVFDLSAFARGLVDCYFINSDTGFVVGASGTTFQNQVVVVLQTTNGGTTWETKHKGTRSSELGWKISFPSRRVGYASIEAFNPGVVYVLKTTDGGATWQDVRFHDSLLDEQGIGFVNENVGWVGGWGNPTYSTVDGGATWQLANFGMNINRFRFLSDTLAYAVGQTVYKYSITPTTAVAGSANEPPDNFALEQNYPNPFNPTTVIRYHLRERAKVSLLVYDLSGALVRTLVASVLQAGAHEAHWNGLNDAGQAVTTGVYVYRLESGNGAQTRKMLLLR